MKMQTATAELSMSTRKYCAAGIVESPKMLRNSPEVALPAHSAK